MQRRWGWRRDIEQSRLSSWSHSFDKPRSRVYNNKVIRLTLILIGIGKHTKIGSLVHADWLALCLYSSSWWQSHWFRKSRLHEINNYLYWDPLRKYRQIQSNSHFKSTNQRTYNKKCSKANASCQEGGLSCSLSSSALDFVSKRVLENRRRCRLPPKRMRHSPSFAPVTYISTKLSVYFLPFSTLLLQETATKVIL